MNNLKVKVNGKIIELYGSNTIIQKEKQIIENLELTGNETQDRLLIQDCIDKNKLKSDILYDGNSVYPFEKIIKAYRKLQKSGTLDGLTNEMYHFFMYACEDIAHYDLQGFRGYYNNSFRKLEDELLNNRYLCTRFSDRDRIFKELKIGKYFNERDSIDIDKISLNQLKSIIKKCGWDVEVNVNNYMKLSKKINNDITYSFVIDLLNANISKIMKDISYINNSFNKESYIEDMVIKRKEINNPPTISEIVSFANKIKYNLDKLIYDALYKTRIVAEENLTTLNQENIKNNDNFEYEY